eukprot:3000602-Rhodomonas_salina.1
MRGAPYDGVLVLSPLSPTAPYEKPGTDLKYAHTVHYSTDKWRGPCNAVSGPDVQRVHAQYCRAVPATRCPMMGAAEVGEDDGYLTYVLDTLQSKKSSQYSFGAMGTSGE